MSLLTRYMVKEHLKFIGLLLAAFLTIFFTIHILEKIRWLSQAPFIEITQLFLLKIPKMTSDLMPLSIFLATLLTLGTLSRNNEVIPMMSAGMRITGLVAPLLVVGGLISLLFVFFNASLIPYTLKSARVLQQEKIEKGSRGIGGTFSQNKIWLQLRAKTLLSTQFVDQKSHTLYGVHLYTLGSEMPLQSEIEAKALRYEQGTWTLLNGIRREYQKDGTIVRVLFDREGIELGPALDPMQPLAVRPEEMTPTQLTSYIRNLHESEFDAKPYEVALHAQSAFPWASVLLVLLGIPISFLSLRTGGIMKRVLFGLGIVLLYWLLISMAGALGRQGVIPPFVAGWGPHLLCFFAGGALFAHLHKTL